MTPTEFVTNETTTFSEGELIVVSGPDNAAIIDLLMDARDELIGAGKGCLDPLDTRMTVVYPDGLVLSGATPTTTQFIAHNYVSLFENTMICMVSANANYGESRRVLKYDRASGMMTLESALPIAPAVGDGYLIKQVAANDTAFAPVERALKFEYYAITYQATGALPRVVLISNQFDREDPAQNPDPRHIDIDVVRDLLNKKNVENIPSSFNLNDGRYREIFSYISKLYYYDTRAGEITFIKTQIPERP